MDCVQIYFVTFMVISLVNDLQPTQRRSRGKIDILHNVFALKNQIMAAS